MRGARGSSTAAHTLCREPYYGLLITNDERLVQDERCLLQDERLLQDECCLLQDERSWGYTIQGSVRKSRLVLACHEQDLWVELKEVVQCPKADPALLVRQEQQTGRMQLSKTPLHLQMFDASKKLLTIKLQTLLPCMNTRLSIV